MDVFLLWLVFTSNLNSQTTWLKVNLKLVNFLSSTTNQQTSLFQQTSDMMDYYFLLGDDQPQNKLV